MAQACGAPRIDDGTSIIEYVALGVLAATIVAGLALLGVGHTVADGATSVICRITQQRTCRPPRHGTVARPASPTPSITPSATPSNGTRALPCDRRQNRTEKSRTTRFVGYRKDTKNFRQVQYGSDGTVTETSGHETGNGADVRVGVGVKAAKKGIGLSGGGGGTAVTRVQHSIEFASDAQRVTYNAAVQRARASLARTVAENRGYARTHDVAAESRDIPLNVAHQMHIKVTTSKVSGSDSVSGGQGSYGVGSGDASEQESESPMKGRSVNDNGTADERDDITTDTYEKTVSDWSGNVGGSKNFLEKVKPPVAATLGANVKGTDQEIESYQVEWQYGKPISLSIITRDGWTINGGMNSGPALTKKGSGRASRKRSAGGTTKGEDGYGRMTVEKKAIDLRADPAAYALFKRLNVETPAGNLLWVNSDPATHDPNVSPQVRQARRDLEWHLDHHGQDLRQSYTRDYTSGGSSIDLTDGLQFGSRDDTSSEDNWMLDESQYLDPTTRRWRPYACAVHTDGTEGSW